MFLIFKGKDGYRAIPIRTGYNWDFQKVFAGHLEVRIVLRVRGRRYLLWSTRPLSAEYPRLSRAQLLPLCDEIIAITSDCLTNRHEYIDFEKITVAVRLRHQRRWCDQGLIAPFPLERYHGHPIDPKAAQLTTRVRVNIPDVIVMDRTPPPDCEQEELPY